AIDTFQVKVGSLLAYLAYHLRQPHSREALVDLLWPEAEPRDGRNNLSVTLFRLRHCLDPAGSSGSEKGAEGGVIVADRLLARLTPRVVATDVGDFEAALQEAARAGRDEERGAWLGQAVALYRGELLVGHHDSWILSERAWLAERFFQALSHWIA